MQMTTATVALPAKTLVDRRNREGTAATISRDAKAEPPASALFPELEVATQATAPGSVQALVSSHDNVRASGREAALRTSAIEIEGYQIERRELAMREFRGTLTAADKRRAKYVEWQIARIEDAQLGPSLEAWEGIVAEQRRIGEILERQVSTFDAKRRRVPTRQWHKLYGSRGNK